MGDSIKNPSENLVKDFESYKFDGPILKRAHPIEIEMSDMHIEYLWGEIGEAGILQQVQRLLQNYPSLGVKRLSPKEFPLPIIAEKYAFSLFMENKSGIFIRKWPMSYMHDQKNTLAWFVFSLKIKALNTFIRVLNLIHSLIK